MDKRLRRLLWTSGLLPALWIGNITATSAAPQGGKSQIPEIPVVATWPDLLRQEPIAIGDGVRIRLGIEEKRGPVNSGILLYCLTERFQPPNKWSRSDLIGPIAISDSQRDLSGLGDECEDGLVSITGFGLEAFHKQPPGLRRSTLLFLREVYFVHKGKAEIRAVGLDGKVLASVKLEATDQPYHPWMPWTQLSPTFAKAELKEFVVANRRTGIALPYVMSLRPITYRGPFDGKKPDRNPPERLPKLIPDEPSPGFQVSVSHGTITIKSDVGMDVWGPGTMFLTRWWINGKQFTPNQTPASVRYATLGFATSDDPTHALHARMRLDLKAIGAKKGDRVGLQLLHCDDGWQWVAPVISVIPKGWDRDVLPELSNRVEFTAE